MRVTCRMPRCSRRSEVSTVDGAIGSGKALELSGREPNGCGPRERIGGRARSDPVWHLGARRDFWLSGEGAHDGINWGYAPGQWE